MAGIPGIGCDASVVGKPINSFVAGRGVCSSTNLDIFPPPLPLFNCISSQGFFFAFTEYFQRVVTGGGGWQDFSPSFFFLFFHSLSFIQSLFSLFSHLAFPPPFSLSFSHLIPYFLIDFIPNRFLILSLLNYHSLFHLFPFFSPTLPLFFSNQLIKRSNSISWVPNLFPLIFLS